MSPSVSQHPLCVLSRSFPSAGCALDIPAPLLGSFSGLWHLQPYWAGLESCGRDWAQRAYVAQSIRESGRWDEQRCIPAEAACLLRRQSRDGKDSSWTSLCPHPPHLSEHSLWSLLPRQPFVPFVSPLPSWALMLAHSACPGNSAQVLGPLYSRL